MTTATLRTARISLPLVVALAGACANDDRHESDSAESAADDGTPDPSRPQWLSDDWFHDDGRENFADYADDYLDLAPDGSGSYYDDHGIFDFTGEWHLDGQHLTVGDYGLDIRWTPNCAVIEAEGKTYIGTIGRERPDCPTTVAPLTAAERCLVGSWSSSSSDDFITNQDWWTLGPDRAYLEQWDYSGYTSGGSAGSVEGQWRVTDDGSIEITYPNGTSEVRASIYDFSGRSRDSDMDPGCDEDALVPHGAVCAGGDPYECAGEDLRDCATQEIYDCDAACVDAGYQGAGDPPCGIGGESYEQCLCV